jgi:Tfp pilus assembly protein PilV
MTQSVKHHNRNTAADNGFTIVEALIAVVLFTITLAGGLAIYVNTDRIVTLASHKRMAVEMANLRMEEIRAMNYAAFAATFPVSDPAVPQAFADTISPAGGFTAARTITVAHVPPVVAPDYKEVTVHVAWSEADQAGQRDVEVKTIIAP